VRIKLRKGGEKNCYSGENSYLLLARLFNQDSTKRRRSNARKDEVQELGTEI